MDCILPLSSLQSGSFLLNPRSTLTTANWRSFTSRCAAIAHKERNSVPRPGNARVVAARHQNRVVVKHNRNQFRVRSIVVHQLSAKCGIGHVEVDVELF